MSQNLAVLDFIQDLEEKPTTRAVGQAFQRLIEGFGFHYFCIGSIRPGRDERGTVWARTSHPWFNHWVGAKRFRSDPVIWRLKRSGDPFRWRTLRACPETPHLDLMDEAAEFGIRDGWAMAFLVGPENDSAAGIGLGTSHYTLEQDAESSLHLAAVYCGMRLAHFGDCPSPTNERLSVRERECLRWVAMGKTDWDISEILGISEHTVHKHVCNARIKLNAATRAHAVAVAMTTTQIIL